MYKQRLAFCIERLGFSFVFMLLRWLVFIFISLLFVEGRLQLAYVHVSSCIHFFFIFLGKFLEPTNQDAYCPVCSVLI